MTAIRKRVAVAIKKAWEECGEVPFPLYKREADALADAAVNTMLQAIREGLWPASPADAQELLPPAPKI